MLTTKENLKHIETVLNELKPLSGLPILTTKFIEDTVEQVTINYDWNTFLAVMDGVRKMINNSNILIINKSDRDFIIYK